MTKGPFPSAPGIDLGAGLDALGTGRISHAPFVSEAFYERELALWRDAWLLVGRADALAKPGDYATLDLKALHASIFAVRGRDGELRAFHNVCTHRAGRLLGLDHASCAGNVRSVVCRYHGWAFDLEGRLRGVPEEQLFAGTEPRERLGLMPIAIDTWGGFAFVNLNPRPRFPLGEYLSGLPANLGRYLSEQPWRWYTGYQRAFEANWKDLMNIQHEGYHAGNLHQRTLGARFAAGDCRNTVFPDSPGVCSLLTVLRPEVSGDPVSRLTAVQRLSMKYGSTSNWVDQDTSVASARFPGAVNHAGSERFVFDCYTLFPNLILFVGSVVLVVMRAWPLGPHRADWEWDWFFKDEMENFGHWFNREHGRLATRNALTEDWPVCEAAHRNMRSGVLAGSLLGADMEATVRAHYEKLLWHLGVSDDELEDDYA
jgi:phenylpropionate dioxygenase-like ring-hydroxylating dioxygenase large terminal subunit